VTIKRVFER